jgi:molecular chaperone GrpE
VKKKEDQKANLDQPVPHDKPSPCEEGPICLSRQEYENMTARLKELEGTKEQFLRSAADFDNAKKRLVKEREEFLKFGQENLIRGMLTVLDDFDRALSHAEDAVNAEGIAKGIGMVLKKFRDILAGEGLKKLPAVGEQFDPHLHEAVGYVREEGPEDVIVEELEAGYMLHDRLLRPAKVRVRMSPSCGDSGDSSSSEGEGPKQEEMT